MAKLYALALAPLAALAVACASAPPPKPNPLPARPANVALCAEGPTGMASDGLTTGSESTAFRHATPALADALTGVQYWLDQTYGATASSLLTAVATPSERDAVPGWKQLMTDCAFIRAEKK